MEDWVARCSHQIGRRAERELEALVAVSSPSGDAHAAEEAAAVVTALLPTEAQIERPPCSTPDYAPDLNPDEGIWRYLKYLELKNRCYAILGMLEMAVSVALRHIRQMTDIIQSTFRQAGLT